MDKTIVEFIKALRGVDVRVSTSETVDAINTVEFMGYENRGDLKHALAIVIPKTEADKLAYDECFDRFFSFNRFENLSAKKEGGLSEGGGTGEGNCPLSQDSQAESSEGGGSGGEGSGGGEGGGQGGEVSQGTEGRQGQSQLKSELGQMLISGDQAGLAVKMAQAAKVAGLRNIKVITQRGLYGRKIMMEMGLSEMEEEMWALEKSENHQDRALAHRLREGRNFLREEVKDYVGKQFVLHAAEDGKRLREDVMRQVKLQHLYEFKNVQETVRKMARRLISIHSRRRRVLDRGKLDVSNTLKRNIKHDGILIEPQWKSRRVDRPKVMAICDVSGSVSAVSRFLLMFLYSMNEVLPKVRSFAFSGQLGEVTEIFEQMPLEKAIDEALHIYGMGSTDYGSSFEDFSRIALNDIDHNTTIIILGDARNNFGDSRSDVLQEVRDRAKMLIWLNPEAKNRWNSGDAVMREYQPYCTLAEECNSLNHLERVVSRLLKLAT